MQVGPYAMCHSYIVPTSKRRAMEIQAAIIAWWPVLLIGVGMPVVIKLVVYIMRRK